MVILGLPLHVLVVHAVVVLVPLSAAGGLAIAIVPWARRRYGELVVLGSLVAAISTFVAQKAGEAFFASFPQQSPAMVRHSQLGDDLLVWVILLFVGSVVLVGGEWLVQRGRPQGKIAVIIGIVATIVFAIVSLVQAVRVGHSGSFAVWGSG